MIKTTLDDYIFILLYQRNIHGYERDIQSIVPGCIFVKIIPKMYENVILTSITNHASFVALIRIN